MSASEWQVEIRGARGHRLRELRARLAREHPDTEEALQKGELPGTPLELRPDGIHKIPRRKAPLPWAQVWLARLSFEEREAGHGRYFYDRPRIHLLLRPQGGITTFNARTVISGNWPGGEVVLDLRTYEGDSFRLLMEIREQISRHRRIGDITSRFRLPMVAQTSRQGGIHTLTVAAIIGLVVVAAYRLWPFDVIPFIGGFLTVVTAFMGLAMIFGSESLHLHPDWLTAAGPGVQPLQIPWALVEDLITVRFYWLDTERGRSEDPPYGAHVLLLNAPLTDHDGGEVDSVEIGGPWMLSNGPIGLILAQIEQSAR